MVCLVVSASGAILAWNSSSLLQSFTWTSQLLGLTPPLPPLLYNSSRSESYSSSPPPHLPFSAPLCVLFPISHFLPSPSTHTCTFCNYSSSSPSCLLSYTLTFQCPCNCKAYMYAFVHTCMHLCINVLYFVVPDTHPSCDLCLSEEPPPAHNSLVQLMFTVCTLSHCQH